MATATNFRNYFHSVERDNGTTIKCLNEDAPGWLKEAIQSAHSDCKDLPNDWIYEVCYNSVCAFDYGDLTDDYDSIHEWSDGQVDVYSSAVFSWAADMCNSYCYATAEEEAEEFGTSTEEGAVEYLKVIQLCAIKNIAQIMVEACCLANAEEEETEEEED
jgi:hypothetical protein